MELSLAAAISTTLLAAQAQAQAQERASELEEVVVTGSFIPTLPEDAAIPVEVFNFEDLKDMGRPSNIDMIKGLTEVGQSIGEIDRQTGYPIDAATVNLRNLGPRFTTVVFNNRRFPEQYSPATGRFNNVASIPNAAIGNVEVLKSGGAAIYGADAVAGVVNYITRKDVTDLEVNTEYMYIPDSDGDYNIDGVWGKKFDSGGNFMISAAYQHRSKLERIDRDWSFHPYMENPGGWHTYGGAYAAQNGTAATAAGIAIVPPQGPGLLQRGATGVMRDPACTAMGGYAGFSTTGSAICYADYTPTEPLVEKSDSFSLYSELNKTFGGLDFHLEGLAYYRELPEISVMARNGPLTFPLTGTAYTSGTGAGQYDRYTSSTGTPGSGGLTGTPMFSAAGTNPAVRHYLENMALNANGSRAYTPAQIAAITSTGRMGLLQTLWAPIGFGGNPLGQDFDVQKNTTTQWRMSTSLGGDLPSFLGTELEWEVAFTYHYTKDSRITNDIPTYKLQNALNGFGGPGCAENPMPGAGTPGAAGCYYFNPFSSSYARNLYTGAASPYFVGSGGYTGYVPGMGLQNNPDMLRWLYERVSLDRTYRNTIVDPIIRGTTGIDLPGGPIQIALGGQFRRQDEEVNISDNVDREINPCPALPNGARTLNCTPGSRTGGMALSRSTTVLGSSGNNHRDERRHYPVGAVFMQFKLPILSNLNADVVGRYEKFYSDVTDVDNSVAVPAVALKWDPLDWLSLRTSWGKTFSQVNPPDDAPPVRANGTTPVNPFATNSYPNKDVEPEKGTNYSVVFLVRAGNFNATVDYNAITIDDYARTLTANNIVTAMLVDRGQSSSATALINCSSPLLSQSIPGLADQPYARLNGDGVCTQGFSRLNSSTDPNGDGYNGLIGGTINFFGGTAQTNAGQLISNALDVTMSYTFDNVFGGTLIPSFDITYVTKYEFEDFIVAGVTVAPGYDGVGFRNDSTGRLLQGVPQYRAGFGLLYRKDRHAVNLLARFVPSVVNEDESDFTATTARNANIGPDSSVGCPVGTTLTSDMGNTPVGAGTALYGPTCAGYNTQVLSGRRIESYFNLDLVYRVNVTDALSMSLNVSNLLNDDPSFAREQIAYDSGYGSPLGRTVELGATYKF
jgi:iron complex outermembrane recepter protein